MTKTSVYKTACIEAITGQTVGSLRYDGAVLRGLLFTIGPIYSLTIHTMLLHNNVNLQ